MNNQQFTAAAEKKMGPMDRHEFRATRGMVVRRGLASNLVHVGVAIVVSLTATVVVKKYIG